MILEGRTLAGKSLFVDESMRQRFEFIIEIDKLKSIVRRTVLIDRTRQENDAEHTWEMAIMAIVLQEYAEPGTDLLATIRMLLIHDLVEIDAGDTYVYDQLGTSDQADRERAAARRVFGLLPEPLATDLYQAWEEFEARVTPEARFARAIDRLQPLLHNYYTSGLSWTQHGISAAQVRRVMSVITEASSPLGELAAAIIDDSVDRGFLPETIG
jgi:putative hydrolases of HD superfamily